MSTDIVSMFIGADSLWYIIGAVLVFFMQCGFAMVETGFTRAKNAGNIIMKNLMDFSVGTIAFLVLGFGIMCGEDALGGFIGIPTLGMFSLSGFDNVDWANFFFQLVFCATAATIVSGSMAERTKFSAYILYSLFISLIIYPIEAHWVWGGGWLSEMGYFDWAGSTVIHMVGGVMGFIGAAFLGARIGKYDKDGKPNAIAGHSITLGALGVFILWFGWYGFNGAAGGSTAQVAQIFVTTTIGAAAAACTTMFYTWIKDGKPDVSMTLNAALAGLVAITAPCACVDSVGALIIGIVAGLLCPIFVLLIDRSGIDDPVGASTVHGICGIWGGLAVGLFANPDIIATYDVGINAGLFYGGGATQLGIQCIGVLAILAWTAVCGVVLFAILKATIGLRVEEVYEVEGLDISEHGLNSAYADFMPVVPAIAAEKNESLAVDLTGLAPTPVNAPGSMTRISIICNQDKFVALKDTLAQIGVTGMTVSSVMGCGIQKGKTGQYRGVKTNVNLLPKLQIDIVVSEVDPGLVVAAANKVLHTGGAGDGKIFVTNVQDVMRISTGETGVAALNMNESIAE
ncbi:MAG: ammonium transporter [Coriobacteriales bacterium]|jgi:Amt family ammonium transporter